MEKTDRLHYIKVLVSACLMVGASMGLCFYSAGVFYEPLAMGLNISLGEASLSTTFMLSFMALVTLAVPALLRKVRFETLLLIGATLTAGSVLCTSFCFNHYFVYLFSALLGCGTALIGMVPATTMINNWFERQKYGATAMVLASSALSAALFTPLMNYSIEMLGWRMGLVIEAALIVVMMFPVIYWHCPLHPAAAGQVPYGTEDMVVEKKKTPVILIGCYALIAVFSAALIGLPLYFSTLAASIGLSSMTGAVAVSWCMIGNFVFKLVGGWLSDRFKPVLTTGILDLFAVLATAGILICILTGFSSGLIPLAFFYGSAFALNELSLPMLVSNRVSRRRYASIYAILNFLSTVTTAVSISVVGFMYDTLQSFAWIYFLALAEEVIIVLLIWYLIHNERVEDLVTSPNTRSFIEKMRASSQKRKAVRQQKAQQRKEEESRKKAAKAAQAQSEKAARTPSAPAPAPAQPSQPDSVFTQQMKLIDQDSAPALSSYEEETQPLLDSDGADHSETESAADSQKPDPEKTENEKPAASADSPADLEEQEAESLQLLSVYGPAPVESESSESEDSTEETQPSAEESEKPQELSQNSDSSFKAAPDPRKTSGSSEK